MIDLLYTRTSLYAIDASLEKTEQHELCSSAISIVAYLEVVQLLELLHWYHRKSYRKRKWVFQNRIETNMQICFPPL